MPGKVLEADRKEMFEVVVPGADAVAVGCEELGWQELAAVVATAGADTSTLAAAMNGGTCNGVTAVGAEVAAGARPSSTNSDSSSTCRSGNSSREGRAPVVGLFRGAVVLPRSERCYVAARSAAQAGAQQSEGKWTPLVSLQVVPQVSCMCVTCGLMGVSIWLHMQVELLWCMPWKQA
jgi:hypothetical protein